MYKFTIFALSFASFPLSNTYNIQKPVVGSKYCGKVRFPLLGSQDVTLKILSRMEANINLQGFINYNDNIKYYIDKKGKFEFLLSKELEQKLNKVYCKITNARYDNDVATITIKIKPLQYSKDVKLYRINCDRSNLNSEHW